MSSWCHMQFCYRKFGLKIYKYRRISKLSPSVEQSTGFYSSTSSESESKQDVNKSNTSPGNKKDVSTPLPTAYSPEFVETVWYEWWVKQGFFKPTAGDPEKMPSKPPFVMVLPPPNVTGTLHLGHALTNSIQDAIVRWTLMQGREVLWVPGVDHAGIATQVIVEKKLWQEKKKTRHDLGREKFLEEVWKWKHEKGEVIHDQMKRLGSSLDWSRASFTMDQNLSRAVVEAFVRLHEDGLIYRNKRLVNWSCALRSAISDIEVDNIQVEGRTSLPVPGYDKKIPFGILTSFAYPVVNSNEEIVVATTRPETMLGDVAIAVHPEDPRYKHLHGQHITHPITGRLLPVVCDDFVDMEFGTGAVKLTPGHDQRDFEVAERHNLDKLTVIDDCGKMVDVPDPFCGMKRFDARRRVAKILKEINLFRGEEEHTMSIPVCSRSKDIVEPLLKEQWFVDCQEMAEIAVDMVKNGELQLLPSNHKKVWMDWLNGIRDWCVSRQLWWGHRIPAYRVLNQDGMWVSGRTESEARMKAAEELGVQLDQVELRQDEDVLDTWFSSALFPFSVMGWPQTTPDMARFYPTSLLETGSDILFFWVARMVMMGVKLTGQLPFNQVLLHGILRDSQGRKMSKSLGNVIDPMDIIHGISLKDLQKKLQQSNLDPLEVKTASEGQAKDFPQGIPQCGADALRFTLCSYDFQAGEINMDITHAKSNRNYCNKVWQGFRFVQTALGEAFTPADRLEVNDLYSATDKWILSQLGHMIRSCDTHFRSYDLHLVTKSLHQFWLTEFCDVYLECVKPVLQSSNSYARESVKQVLYLCMETYLRAVSPFTPYLAEELYQRLQTRGDNWPASVCVAPYPQPEDYDWADAELDCTMSVVKEICHQSLAVRRDLNLTKLRASAYLICTDTGLMSKLSDFSSSLQTLSRSRDFSLVSDRQSVPASCLHLDVNDTCTLAVLIQDVVDPVKELPGFKQKVSKLEAELSRLAPRLQNQSDNLTVKKLTDKIDNLKKQAEKFKRIISILEDLK